MNFKILSSIASLLLIIILAPFLSVLGTVDLLHGHHHHGHGHDGHHHHQKTLNERLAELNQEEQQELIKKEQKKINTHALRSSWYELLNKSQLTKKQDIRVFKLPEDKKTGGTGLTVLWGTWFQFTDKNGDTWNVNAPFSYTKYDKAGYYDPLPKHFTSSTPSTEQRKAEVKRLRQVEEGKNTKRLAENIFNDVSLFKAKVAGQKRELTEVKQTALKDLFTFNDFPVLDKAEENTLRYVANFASEEYLTNPAGHVHYQKLISTPEKIISLEEPETTEEPEESRDKPFLAGYEADELFFNWHPKLRGVQLINTKQNSNKFYQFSIGWGAWGATNKLKNKRGKTYSVSPSNLPLLRAMLTIRQLTKNLNPADEFNHEETTDANRLAWLLRDNKDYADHDDEDENTEESEDSHHEDEETDLKPADIFAIIFKNGDNDETFKDWVLTPKEIKATEKIVAEIKKLTIQTQNLKQKQTILNKIEKLKNKMDQQQKDRYEEAIKKILAGLAPNSEKRISSFVVLPYSSTDIANAKANGWTLKNLTPLKQTDNTAESSPTEEEPEEPTESPTPEVNPAEKEEDPIKVLNDGLKKWLNFAKPPYYGYDRNEEGTNLFWEVQKEQRKKVEKIVAEIKKLVSNKPSKEEARTAINNIDKLIKKMVKGKNEKETENRKEWFQNIMALILKEWAPSNSETTDLPQPEEPEEIKEINEALKYWKTRTKLKIDKVNRQKASISRMFNTVHILKYKHLFEIKKPAVGVFLTSVGLSAVGATGLASYLFYFDKRKLAKNIKLKKLATGSGAIFGIIGILSLTVFWVGTDAQDKKLKIHNDVQNHVGHDHAHDHKHEEEESDESINTIPTTNPNNEPTSKTKTPPTKTETEEQTDTGQGSSNEDNTETETTSQNDQGATGDTVNNDQTTIKTDAEKYDELITMCPAGTSVEATRVGGQCAHFWKLWNDKQVKKEEQAKTLEPKEKPRFLDLFKGWTPWW